VSEVLKQAPQRGRRGQRRLTAPVAPEHTPGLQPGPHAAQRHRPADLWAHSAYFPPPRCLVSSRLRFLVAPRRRCPGRIPRLLPPAAGEGTDVRGLPPPPPLAVLVDDRHATRLEGSRRAPAIGSALARAVAAFARRAGAPPPARGGTPPASCVGCSGRRTGRRSPPAGRGQARRAGAWSERHPLITCYHDRPAPTPYC
jgi:hypothetical protein